MSGEPGPLLRGWRRTPLADGLLLSPPDGSPARIRIWPELAPLEPLRALADRVVGPEREGPHLLATAEGEYGAAATVRDRAAGVQRTVAWVFGRGSYAAFEGIAGDPSQWGLVRDAVEQLAHFHALGLGVDRWRPFFYTPPAGWSAIAQHRSVCFIPPDYPRSRTELRVFEARPLQATAPSLMYRRLYEQLPRELGSSPPPTPEPLTTRHGLPAELLVFEPAGLGADPRVVVDAKLSDGRYAYLLRLECPAARLAEMKPVFVATVVSVRPLPAVHAEAVALVQWAD